MTKPLQIASNFVVTSGNVDADTVDVTDTIVHEPTQMMFVTPGEGTDKREHPLRGDH